jgi:pyruvate/2-oxoacid:ferredoxin oxidoreductase beta subunit
MYQIENRCFSLVELISTCPTNWGMTPVEAVNWVEENMLKYYPLGEFKTPETFEDQSSSVKLPSPRIDELTVKRGKNLMGRQS